MKTYEITFTSGQQIRVTGGLPQHEVAGFAIDNSWFNKAFVVALVELQVDEVVQEEFEAEEGDYA